MNLPVIESSGKFIVSLFESLPNTIWTTFFNSLFPTFVFQPSHCCLESSTKLWVSLHLINVGTSVKWRVKCAQRSNVQNLKLFSRVVVSWLFLPTSFFATACKTDTTYGWMDTQTDRQTDRQASDGQIDLWWAQQQRNYQPIAPVRGSLTKYKNLNEHNEKEPKSWKHQSKSSLYYV